MDRKRFGHAELESLGQKLDRFAEDLTDDERDVLAAMIEVAGQRGTADPDLALSDRLHRLRGRLDAGPFHVIM